MSQALLFDCDSSTNICDQNDATVGFASLIEDVAFGGLAEGLEVSLGGEAFKVLHKVNASGAFGEIYMAARLVDGHMIAIKCPRRRPGTNFIAHERIEQARQEVKMLLGLAGSPFIVKMLPDLLDSAGRVPLLCLDWAFLGTLRSWLSYNASTGTTSVPFLYLEPTEPMLSTIMFGGEDIVESSKLHNYERMMLKEASSGRFPVDSLHQSQQSTILATRCDDRLSTLRVLDIGIQLAKGLKFAHDKGIWHCDLKPENILVKRVEDTWLHVEICDFNISGGRPKEISAVVDQSTAIGLHIQISDDASFESPRTVNTSSSGHTSRADVSLSSIIDTNPSTWRSMIRTGTAGLGTAGYRDMGQAMGVFNLGNRQHAEDHLLHRCIDIYSLGVILFEMLTGTPEFSARRRWEPRMAIPRATTTSSFTLTLLGSDLQEVVDWGSSMTFTGITVSEACDADGILGGDVLQDLIESCVSHNRASRCELAAFVSALEEQFTAYSSRGATDDSEDSNSFSTYSTKPPHKKESDADGPKKRQARICYELRQYEKAVEWFVKCRRDHMSAVDLVMYAECCANSTSQTLMARATDLLGLAAQRGVYSGYLEDIDSHTVSYQYAKVESLLEGQLRDYEDYPDDERKVMLMKMLTRIYLNQQKFAQAEDLAYDCYDRSSRLLGESNCQSLTALSLLGRVYDLRGKQRQAEKLYRRVVDLRKASVTSDGFDEHLCDSVRALALVLNKLGEHEVAEVMMCGCLERIIEQFGPVSAQTLSYSRSLACVLSGQCKYEEVEQLYLVCLKKSMIDLGKDHPDTLSSMGSLAGVYFSQGRYGEAKQLYLSCWEKEKALLGEDHQSTLVSMGKLAQVYGLQGSYCEAERMHLSCLEKMNAVLGKNHPDTLTSENCLAFVYDSQGRYGEAEYLYLSCWEKQKTLLGEDHPDTLVSVNNLARVYGSQGKYNEAERMYVACYQKQQTLLGEDHPSALLSMINLASMFDTQGRYAEAEHIYRSCWERMKVVLGEDHPSVLISMSGLARVCGNQGKYDEAEQLHLSCLKKQKMRLGELHSDTLTSMNNLASVYENKGSYEEAEQLYLSCWEKEKLKLGENHPSVLTTMGNLASVHNSRGRYDEAERLYQSCWKRMKAVLGDNHPHTLALLTNLATVYKSQGRYNQAERLYLSCWEKTKAVLSEDHPHALDIMGELAGVFYSQRRYGEAKRLLFLCLEKKRATLSDAHPSVLNTMHDLAIVLDSQGKSVEAVSLLAECYKKCKIVFSEEHTKTVTVRDYLVDIYRRLGDYSDAESVLREYRNDVMQRLGAVHERSLKAAVDLCLLNVQFSKLEPKHQAMLLETIKLVTEVLGDDHDVTKKAKTALNEFICKKRAASSSTSRKTK